MGVPQSREPSTSSVNRPSIPPEVQGTIVFLPSLVGAKQEAVLALHSCWAVTDALRCLGGAPPPPLMVMVADMLRRPSASGRDGSVSTAEQSPVTWDVDKPVTVHFDGRLTMQSFALCDLVKADDVFGIAVMPLLAVSEMIQKSSMILQKSSIMRYVDNLIWSVLESAVLVAWHQGAYRGLVTLIKRLVANYGHMYHPPIRASSFVVQGAAPPPLPQICPPVLASILRVSAANFKRLANGVAIDVAAELDAVLWEHDSAKAFVLTRLPVGDVRALLVRHALDTSHDALLASFAALIARGHVTMTAAVEALMAIDRGDVAAMLAATQWSHGAAPRDVASLRLSLVRSVGDAELATVAANHGRFAPAPEETRSPVPSAFRLMAAFDGSGTPTITTPAAPELNYDSWHILLRKIAADASPRCAPPPYRGRLDFERCWRHQLRGLLDGWDWSNCIAAGGAVVRALVGPPLSALPVSPEEEGEAAGVTPWDGDVDLFFYGVSNADLRRRLQVLERHVRAKVGPSHYAVLLTSKTVTIVVDDMPRLQVALGQWSCAGDVLSTCDVDCCGAGYDGRDVWLTGRAAIAYATRTNTASVVGHRARGSIQYEMRLWKYAARYGFAVLDPLHDAKSERVAQVRQRFSEELHTSSQRVETARRIATTQVGLSWLIAVDAGYCSPVDTVSGLAVGRGTVADVVKKVQAVGYVEGDGYGTHEEGFVVAEEDDGSDGAGDDDDYDDDGVFTTAIPFLNSSFARRVPLCDIDAVDVHTMDPTIWTL